MNEWATMLSDASNMFVFLAVELSVLFLIISAGVALARQKFLNAKIQQVLGQRQGKGYLIATALGSLTPFCSCSTIPMLRGLLSAKAGFGPTLTFLFVSPLLNPIIVGLMWVSFGWEITLTYIVIAAGVSLFASLLLDKLGFERYVITDNKRKTSCCTAPAVPDKSSASTSRCTGKPVKGNSIVTSSSQSEHSQHQTIVEHSRLNYRQAGLDAWQQFKEVLPYLALGVLLGSFIYGFVPAEWIAAHAGSDNPFAVPLSAVIGIPLYIRAEAVIPLASSLLGKGMGIGAVMALIIGSAGASLTEVILLKSMFKTPMIAAFLAVILGMAVMMGYLVTSFF
ncbi:permease [Deefgea piscis]|uniref:permease n=1 Tax=Deefgea piscis TaxID=2739061 RepID=UPI001C7EB42B|nr:permease [Deefgea piscis]QZA80140.1 permease [Deefgea piscis]